MPYILCIPDGTILHRAHFFVLQADVIVTRQVVWWRNIETSRTLHRQSDPVLTGSLLCPAGMRGLLACLRFSSQREAPLVRCISACMSNPKGYAISSWRVQYSCICPLAISDMIHAIFRVNLIPNIKGYALGVAVSTTHNTCLFA